MYTLAAGGGDTLFEIPKGISGGSERDRERESVRADEQRKGTTTWRLVACRELLRKATVRQCEVGEGVATRDLQNFQQQQAKLKVHGHSTQYKLLHNTHTHTHIYK